MKYAKPPRGKFPFNRDRLPRPAQYYKSQDIKLTGGSEWKKAHCPFHLDKERSLLVRLDSGGFQCRACRRHGGDVVDFHMQLYGMGFIEAVKDLGAWDYDHETEKEGAQRPTGFMLAKSYQPEALHGLTDQNDLLPPNGEMWYDS